MENTVSMTLGATRRHHLIFGEKFPLSLRSFGDIQLCYVFSDFQSQTEMFVRYVG